MNWPENFINKVICEAMPGATKDIPDESINMCMTSPPYWGLRDYGIEQIFGGDKDCKHEWLEEKMTLQHENRNLITGTQEQAHKKRGTTFIKKYDDKKAGFCLKCGAWKGQLGLEPTPEMYIEHLTEIFNEVKRVLKKEGTLWLNIGDTYGGSGCGRHDYREKESISPIALFSNKDNPQQKLMSKCLLMIPERLAWSLIQNGWILRNKIIWFKPNSMPSSVKDRFRNRWEYLFMFSKNSIPFYWTNTKTLKLVIKKPAGIHGIEGEDWEWREIDDEPKKVSLWRSHNYYFDLDAVKEPHKYDGRKDTLYKGGPKDMQIGPHERWPDPSGKNPGDVIETPAETRTLGAILGSGKAVKVPGGKGWTGHPPGGENRCKKDPRWCPPEGKNPGDFWNINTQPFPEAHFAVFPERLCEKPIKAGCPKEVCKKCKKPKEKIIKAEGGTIGKSGHDHKDDLQRGNRAINEAKGGHGYHRIFLGYVNCNCNAGFEGGIVLDPFAGAGTVGVVAKELGRRFILIDIKKEYCEMAEKRINQVGYQMELRV